MSQDEVPSNANARTLLPQLVYDCLQLCANVELQAVSKPAMSRGTSLLMPLVSCPIKPALTILACMSCRLPRHQQ